MSNAEITFEPLDADWSQTYFAVFSQQSYNSQYPTNVFTTAVPIKRFNQGDINVVHDYVDYKKWALTSIIQRNISDERVEDIKENYLQNKSRITKFFPAITIVLVPIKKDNEGIREPLQEYNSTNENGSDLNSISGLEMKSLRSDGAPPESGEPVQLRWDRNSMAAFVVDGQHRVKAIQSQMKTQSQAQDWTVPVTIVVFDPKIGNALKATRGLFVDVNNTPKHVAEQRLIFIDDHSLLRRFTASVIGVQHSDNDPYLQLDNSESIDAEPYGCLSLQLISEERDDDDYQQKFRQSSDDLYPWEITPLLVLHDWIIRAIVFEFKPENGSDLRAVAKWINSKRLGDLVGRNTPTLAYSDTSEFRNNLKDSSFQYSDAEIEVFLRLFNRRYELDQELSDIDSDSTDDRNDQEEIESRRQEAYSRFDTACRDPYVFVMRPDEISDLLGNRLREAKELVAGLLNQLWYVRGIVKAFEAIAKRGVQERSTLYSFIGNMHQSHDLRGQLLDPQRRRRNQEDSQKIKAIIDNYMEHYGAQHDEDKQREILKDFISKCYELNPENNLMRYVVGQQVLFLFARDCADNSIPTTVDFINKIGRKSILNKEFSLDLPKDLKPEKARLWSEILVRPDLRMKPGRTSANKAKTFLYCIQSNTRYRKDFEGNSSGRPIGLSDFNRLTKTIGRALRADVFSADSDLALKLSAYVSKNRKGSEKEADVLARFMPGNQAPTTTWKKIKDFSKDQTFRELGEEKQIDQILGAITLPHWIKRIREIAEL